MVKRPERKKSLRVFLHQPYRLSTSKRLISIIYSFYFDGVVLGITIFLSAPENMTVLEVVDLDEEEVLLLGPM